MSDIITDHDHCELIEAACIEGETQMNNQFHASTPRIIALYSMVGELARIVGKLVAVHPEIETLGGDDDEQDQ